MKNKLLEQTCLLESQDIKTDFSALSSFRGSDSDRRILTKPLNDGKRGFTLAETLITLTVLGIIAAITIPVLIGKQLEAQNRTKVKKSMAAYEQLINKIIIDNELQTEASFKAWIKNDATIKNYADELSYFKILEMSATEGYTNCRFKTSDKVWWDICGTDDSNIENPIIILDEMLAEESRTNLETMATKDKDNNGKRLYVYAFVGRSDEATNSLRVNDKAYETTSPNKDYLEKLYAFIEKRAMTDANNNNEVGQLSPAEQFEQCKNNLEDSCTDENGNNWNKMSFSNEPTTLSNDYTSTPYSSGDKYVTIAKDADGKDWNNAQTACPDGSHLARVSELKQMWNNGETGNLLEKTCETCSEDVSPRFWAEESNASNTDRAYIFAILRGNGTILSGPKTNTNKVNHVICVSN